MKTIILKSKKHGDRVTIVDDSDFDKVKGFVWSLVKKENSFYAHVQHWKEKNIYMHRFILDVTDPKVIVDHKDMDGLNNQRSNLRPCTKSQNAMNGLAHKDAISKYRGVTWDKVKGKWVAQIGKNYKHFFIGRFNLEREAALAYNQKAVELHGEFANINIL